LHSRRLRHFHRHCQVFELARSAAGFVTAAF
jgi:hypothetical protein